MSDFRFIKESLFECSVPLEGAVKEYVINGCGTSKSGAIVNRKGGRICVDTSRQELLQLICVRDYEGVDASYQIDISTGGSNDVSGSVQSAVGKKATLLLCSHTMGDSRYVTNERINILVGEGESLDVIVMQNENGRSLHNSEFNIDIKENGALSFNVVTLYGGAVNNKIAAKILGKGAKCELNGLYLGSGEQIINTNIDLFHKVGGSISNQLFKGILDDKSKAAFTGSVVVEKDAQATEAYQANNNLLISDGAKAVSKPELIIYADDVKCSHGSTVGSIGSEELFYMRSRGISLREAQLLQQQAFAAAVLERIGNEELRSRLGALVERRLRGESVHCQSCSQRCCR